MKKPLIIFHQDEESNIGVSLQPDFFADEEQTKINGMTLVHITALMQQVVDGFKATIAQGLAEQEPKLVTP